MAGKATSKRAESEVYTDLVIKVETYEASVSAGVNHLAYDPQYGWHSDGEEPVYELRTCVVVLGAAVWPEERAGDRCEVTLYGSPGRDLDARLKDLAELDEHGSPRYRTYRGREVPVYRPPRGLGVLHKVRGEPAWTTYLFVKPEFVDRWLALLGRTSGLFVNLRECKIGRDRWIRSIGLHTADPTEE
jgi:hypothetical protein